MKTENPSNFEIKIVIKQYHYVGYALLHTVYFFSICFQLVVNSVGLSVVSPWWLKGFDPTEEEMADSKKATILFEGLREKRA